MENHNFDNIPAELRSLKRWICWKYVKDKDGKLTKEPRRPGTDARASSRKPEHWCSFSEAVAAYKQNPGRYSGIGFVFAAGDGFVGVDIDDCIKEGGISENARQIINKFPGAYVERSVSGNGIHIICRGNIYKYLPKEGNRTGVQTAGIDGIKKLEIYCEGRYFALTGELIV